MSTSEQSKPTVAVPPDLRSEGSSTNDDEQETIIRHYRPTVDHGDWEEVHGRRQGDRFVRIVRPSLVSARATQSGVVIATERDTRPDGGLSLAWYRLWRFMVGPPIPTSRAIHERLGRIQALAILSSDALSSVAYGPEQIFLQLMLAGAAAMSYGVWVGVAIALLMAVVGISYRQTIRAYPSGGGSYIVAKDNLGTLPGLTAGASLLVDYILTVAVSVAAGAAAVTSAFPSLLDYRVGLCLFFILLITIGNLRGIRESGAIFAAPTYVFIVTMYGLIVVGIVKFALAGGSIPPLPHPPIQAFEGLSLFLVLRAFASGCSAMTGMEAISNGVPAFKPPEAEHARSTLTWMSVILVTMFMGTMFLAIAYQAVPRPDGSETMVSILARGIVGTGLFYYLLQAGTALILVLAANTSYADFPRLASLLARDKFLPTQFTYRGDRLAFNTGIIVLSLLSAVLVIAYHGATDALIPLYAIGVFVSFTLSQAGMVRHWQKLRTPGWRTALTINGTGAVATGVVSVVTGVAKFSEGAWIVILIIPFLIFNFVLIHRHYSSVAEQLKVDEAPPEPITGQVAQSNSLFVPMASVNKATLRTLTYALSLGLPVTVVQVAETVEAGQEFEAKLRAWWPTARVVVIESPFRALIGPLLSYLDSVHQREPERTLTVVIPEFLPGRWWEYPLHNQTALRLKAALLFRRGIAVLSVPYHLL
ncbi:MAG TPA: APC family permease [Chloroflexota bacterium]|nr:APC family permease [Chloroflexota bacterium]